MLDPIRVAANFSFLLSFFFFFPRDIGARVQQRKRLRVVGLDYAKLALEREVDFLVIDVVGNV